MVCPRMGEGRGRSAGGVGLGSIAGTGRQGMGWISMGGCVNSPEGDSDGRPAGHLRVWDRFVSSNRGAGTAPLAPGEDGGVRRGGQHGGEDDPRQPPVPEHDEGVGQHPEDGLQRPRRPGRRQQGARPPRHDGVVWPGLFYRSRSECLKFEGGFVKQPSALLRGCDGTQHV